MKNVMLLLLLALSSTAASAGDNRPNSGNSTTNNAAATGIGVGNGGTMSVEAADYSDLRIVPSAIAPSVNTSVICPIVMQGSKAGSFFFFSGSGTHAPDIVPICVAWHLGQTDVVEKLTCAASKEYAAANTNCSK